MKHSTFRLAIIAGLLVSAHEATTVANEYLAEVTAESAMLETTASELDGSMPGISVQLETAPAGGEAKLSVGTFDTFVDAWVASRLIGEAAPIHGIQRSVQQTAGSGATRVDPLSIRKAFSTVPTTTDVTLSTVMERNGASRVGSVDQVILEKPVTALTRQELLEVGRNAPGNQQGIPALERFITENPSAPEVNQTRMRLARRLMGRSEYAQAKALLADVEVNGSAEEKSLGRLLGAYATMYDKGTSDVMPVFKQIAEDELAPPAVRREAMRRYAGSAHANRNYPEAWLAFRQIAESPATPEEDKAEAELQLAGLAFEISRGKTDANWDEVRQRCQTVLQNPIAPHQMKATAALMHLETHYEQRAFTTALTEIAAFESAYADVKREHSMALLWKGLILAETGQHAQALEALEAVKDLELEDSEKFHRQNPEAKALVWMVYILREQDRVPEARARLAELASRFPGSPELERASSYLPNAE